MIFSLINWQACGIVFPFLTYSSTLIIIDCFPAIVFYGIVCCVTHLYFLFSLQQLSGKLINKKGKFKKILDKFPLGKTLWLINR